MSLFRIADQMKPEGSFYAETESSNLVDYKPERPVINRWGFLDIDFRYFYFILFRIKDSMADK